MLDVLDRLQLDWTDLEKVTAINDELLHELAADKRTLARLLERCAEEQSLFAQCERHRLLDKLVIYDGSERGFRIRLHVSTNDHLDRPHDHRFSFSSLILAGGYRHVRHRLVGDLDTDLAPEAMEDHQAVGSGLQVEPQFATEESAGSFYTIHHSAIHTTVMAENTVSLFIRGPAEKDRSLIIDRASGQLWWRYGAQQETQERRERKQMDLSHFELLKHKLSTLDVI
jgi:hypothetical protein